MPLTISNRDFGEAIFNAIRTGVPELNIVLPKDNRTLDINNDVMLAQRRTQVLRRKRQAQHAGGNPIICSVSKAMKRERVEAIREENKAERGRMRKERCVNAAMEAKAVLEELQACAAEKGVSFP